MNHSAPDRCGLISKTVRAARLYFRLRTGRARTASAEEKAKAQVHRERAIENSR